MINSEGVAPLDRLIQILINTWHELRIATLAKNVAHVSPAESLYLSFVIDDLINDLRSTGNPRELLIPPSSSCEDLLELGEDGAAMPALHALRDCIQNKTSLAEWDATVAVAIIATHCALLDRNFKAIGEIKDWFNVLAPTGETPDKHATLAAASAISYLEHSGNEPQLVKKFRYATDLAERNTQDLSSILSEEHKADAHAARKRLILHLVQASTSLPAREWREQSNSRDEIYTWSKWIDEIDSETLGLFESSDSRFQAAMAHIFLARNRLGDAEKRVKMALESAKPHMTWHIERCDQLLFTIQIEEAARSDITQEVVSAAKSQIDSKMESAKEDFNDLVEKKTADFDQKNRADTAEQINAAVLRIVEILGIFVAISFVLFTGVEGFVTADTIGKALAIYGIGFGSVTVLMWLIYLMVLKLQHRTQPHRIERNITQHSE